MDLKIKKRLLLAIFISICFMGVLLSRVDWGHFSLIVSRLEMPYLAAACIVFILGNLLRAMRFIKLDHMDKDLRYWWNVNAFYNTITATLPGGAGEVASAYVLKRFSQFNLLSAVRILLLSRFLDLFAISAVFFFAALQMSDLSPYRNIAVFVAGALLLLSLIALIPATEQFVMRLLQKFPAHNAFVKKISEKLSQLINIAEAQRRNHTFGTTLFQSVMMMIAGGISMHLVLRSLGVEFTLVQSFYCYGVYFIFQIVPVQGIAGIGTQAAWWALALKASGYQGSESVALGIVLHGTFYAFIGIIGVLAMLNKFLDSKAS